MCNSAACQHDDLNDDFDDVFGASLVAQNAGLRAFEARQPVDTTLADAQQMKMTHEERCSKCRGTGRFTSYSGRTLGNCFACKGSGKLTFRTSPEQRAKAAVQRENSAQRKAEQLAEQVRVWAETHNADYSWICAKSATFDFARNMLDALRKYGSLTDKQHATVTRLQLADAERQAAFAAERAAREANAQAVDVSKIEQAFANAREKGIQRPKTYLGSYKFAAAPSTGKNAGAIYVTDTQSDEYLGKVSGGRFLAVKACTGAQEIEILAVLADPKEAAIAFGRRTGRCSCCGRELTNHASIDLGIGPICAEKYGW